MRTCSSPGPSGQMVIGSSGERLLLGEIVFAVLATVMISRQSILASIRFSNFLTGHILPCASLRRPHERLVHEWFNWRTSVNPSGVSTPSTGMSCASCGTGLSVGSQGQQTATARDPTARYSSARSYHPPPRPKRNPFRRIDGKSGNDDQSSVFQRFGPTYAVAGFLRTMCVGGAVAVGLIAQIVDAVKLAPTNIRAFFQAVERVRGSLNRKAPAALVSSTFRYPWMRMRPPW